MSTGADSAILEASRFYSRAIAGAPTIDYTAEAEGARKEFGKLQDVGKGLAVQQQKRLEIEKAKEEKKRIDEFNKKAKAYEDSIKGLPPEQQATLISHLEQQAAEYAENGEDSDSRSAIMQDLDQRTLSIENVNAFKDEVVTSFRLSDKATELAGIFDGTTEMVYQDGKYGFMMNDKDKEVENQNEIKDINTQLNELDDQFQFGGIDDEEYYFAQQQELENKIIELEDDIRDGSKTWASHHDVRGIIAENSFDKSINNTILSVGDGEVERGKNGEDFDFDEMRDGVFRTILKDGTMRSLKEDPHIRATDEDGKPRIWENDMKEAILLGPTGEGTKYEDLGLDPTTINALDPTPDGIISVDDALAIYDAIDNDEDLSSQFLANYFTSHYEKQHQKGYKKYLAEQKKKQGNNEINGGAVGTDGVWVPNA
mgnify:CR=1 FL=1